MFFNSCLKRIILSTLCLAIILGLTGCSKASDSPILNADGTIGEAAWGDTLETLSGKLGDNFTKNDTGAPYTELVVDGGKLFGMEVSISYLLQNFSAGTNDELLLYAIRISPKNGEDVKSLSDDITGVFGEPETTGRTFAGESYALDESQQYWHSEKSVHELMNEDLRARLLEDYDFGNNPMGVPAEEYLDYSSTLWYPFQASFIEDEEGNACLEINGNYAVILR